MTNRLHLLLLGMACMAGSYRSASQCGGIDFTTNTTSGCIPLQVYVNAHGFTAGSEFSWDFGNGYSSYSVFDSVYQHFFTAAGTYSVNLKVKLPGGTVCTISKNKLVTAAAPPKLNIAVFTPVVCSLTDTAEFADSTPGVVKRDWVVEGVKYNSQHVRHRFNSEGYKTVSMIVTDNNGCVASLTGDTLLQVFAALRPDFTVKSTAGCPGLADTFKVLMKNPTQQITAWQWTLPGASLGNSSDTQVAVVYNKPGSFAATLGVTTANGCNYSTTKQALVKIDTLPNLSFAHSSSIVCNDQLAVFVNTSSGQGAGTFSWQLQGGGTIKSVNAKADTLKVGYTTPGKYGIKLSYKNNNCGVDTTVNNLINYAQLKTKFVADAQFFCQPGDSVRLTDSSSSVPAGPLSRIWEIFDKNTQVGTDTAASFVWKYPYLGKFKVVLTVQANSGCVDSVSKNDFIVADTPRAAFRVSSQFICPGDSVFFSDNTPGYSSKQKLTRIWTIYATNQSTVVKTDTGSRTFYVFADTGIYHAKMITQNTLGCSDSAYDSLGVAVAVPKLDFKVDSPEVCSGGIIQLVQTTDPVMPHLKYQWKINHHDSANIILPANGDTVEMPMNTPGLYDVELVNLSKNCPDTLSYANFFAVNGLSLTAWADTAVSCLPVVVRGHSAIAYNLHQGNADSTVQYTWGADPLGPVFSGADSAATNISFVKNGCHNISLKASNSSGCQAEVPLVYAACVGGIADFAFQDGIVCSGDTIRPKNNSKPHLSHRWALDTGNASAFHMYPSDTATSPYFLINEEGNYLVMLIVQTLYGCPDTVRQNIIVKKPSFTFTSPDTFSICGPTTVSFSAVSSNTSKFTWEFGDGSSLTSPVKTIYHIYKINKGKNTFDVKVRGQDAFGCEYLQEKKGYIRISGPAPYFTVSHFRGCDSLTVLFADSSLNVERFFFYNDDGPADSVVLQPHRYSVKNQADTFSAYKPFLIGFDSTGQCVKSYSPADSIVVAVHPTLKMQYTDSVTCVDKPLAFYTDSQHLYRFAWDFDNNGSIDDVSPSASYTSSKPGSFNMRLHAFNRFSCSSQLTRFGLITIKDKPKAAVWMPDSVFCMGDTVKFADASTYSSAVAGRQWNFGDTTLNDTSSQAKASYYYGHDGLFDVCLKVTDQYGCSDSVVMHGAVHIYNQFAPEKSNVLYVTNRQNDVEVVWNRNNSTHFEQYKLFRIDSQQNQQMIFSSSNVDDTIYTDAGRVNAWGSHYLYGVSSDELCYKKQSSEQLHPNLLLHATALPPQHIRLNWNAYTGWDSVKHYDLYRTANGGMAVHHARILSPDTSWIDRNLCDSDYRYTLVAVRYNAPYSSATNEATEPSPYTKPGTAVDIKTVSVTLDDKVLLRWDTTGNFAYTNRYHVYRLGEPNPVWKHIAEPRAGSWLDGEVDVQQNSYQYKVVREDLCRNPAPESEVSNSILLSASSSNDSTLLSWNGYRTWQNGVARQTLQWYNQNEGTFVKVATLAGGDSNWQGVIMPDFTLENMCYRLFATGHGANSRDTSFSNMACVQFSARVYVPNTFTPNADGLNETFKPTVSFVHTDPGQPVLQYRLMVLDQWGEKIFESHDPQVGWDGTKGGKPCPTGRYAYIVQAVGFKDKNKITEKGWFNLMR